MLSWILQELKNTLEKLAVAVNLEAIWFEFWMKGALVTVVIFVFCCWWFPNQFDDWTFNIPAMPRSLLIVNRGEWLGSPGNIKGANKDLSWKATTVQTLLFCAHTQYMTYVTNTFLLVNSSSALIKQLIVFFARSSQKSEQKPTTGSGFITIPLY